jgi:acyl-CoA synthetase (AMP-forming)/AMP-acid ligase II
LNAGGDAQRRFIADDTKRLNLSALVQAGVPSVSLDRLKGRAVVLALATQLETAIALIQLDGVARRIILWPHDLPRQQIFSVLPEAEVDVTISEWPHPELDDHGALLTGAAAGPAASDGAAPYATEWVLFTSGTAGRPKMVAHTLDSLAGHLRAAAPSGNGPIWCTFYDIRRYGGLQILLRALIGAGSLVLSSPDEAPAAFLARAAAAGATHFLGTPSHWRRALMTDAADRISPEYVRLSGEVADQVILDKLRAAYPHARIVHAFASTEAGLAFEVADGEAGFSSRLIDQSGAASELRVSDGSLRVRSPRTALGYLDGSLSKIADHEGFVDTGDIVELRGDRYYFAGRRDGTVNVGGQKVHPEEVETVINQHPGVQMSRVSARASPITGAIVVAEIVCRSVPATGSALPPDAAHALQTDIREFCRAHLPPHKVPAAIRIVPCLEIAPSGKLVRLSA